MSKAYFITYDSKNEDDYTKLIEAIKSLATNDKKYISSWESSHLIKSNHSEDEIVDKLTPFFNKGSKLIVFEVNQNIQGLLNETEWKKIKEIID